MHGLAVRAQRLAAGGQQVHRRRAAKQPLGQPRNGPDHMLAAIEHDQHPLVGQEGEDGRLEVDALDEAAERQRDGARNIGRIGERTEIDEANRAVAELPAQRVGDRHGDRRLADAARPDDGDEALRQELCSQRGDGLRPADQQPRGRRERLRLRRPGADSGRAVAVRAPDRRGEGVAAAGNVDDVFVRALPQRLPQGGDLHPKIGFLDDDVRPDAFDQLPPAHDLARPVDQRDQDVKRAAPQHDRFDACAHALDPALRCGQAERSERDDILPAGDSPTHLRPHTQRSRRMIFALFHDF